MPMVIKGNSSNSEPANGRVNKAMWEDVLILFLSCY